MSWPRNLILPARGLAIPAMARISDDLPAPFAPMSATSSPLGTSREMPASACASP
jgi:hypothetical protein